MIVCKYCGKELKSRRSQISHETICKSNPNRILTPYEKGIPPFRTKKQIHNLGEDSPHDDYDRQCPVCGRWFTKKAIGGHTFQCRVVNGRNKSEEPYKVNSLDTLDVTYREIEDYRRKISKCEICGRTVNEASKYKGKFAAKKLCVDHDHITKKFRGLLCTQCNRALGWYENNKDKIEEYLNKGSLV